MTDFEVSRHEARVRAGLLKASPEAAIAGLPRPDAVDREKTLHRVKLRSRKGYNALVVIAYFESQGLPEPEVEHRFHPKRKWAFDFAWPFFSQIGHGTDEEGGIALEVDGGIWIQGGHNRGAQMLKTWEKENEAVCMGWRILRCQPKDLCTLDTVNMLKRALNIST